MRSLQAAILDSVTRIRRFLDANDASLGAVNQSEGRRIVDQVATQLAGHAVEQGSRKISAVGETKRVRQLEAALRKSLMLPVAEMARAKRTELPQVADFRMPKGSVGGTRLVAAALAMADAATPHVPVFVAGGLRPDFVDRLRAGAQALRDALAARVDHRRGRSGATIGLSAEANRARTGIRMVNASVTQHLADQPELLAQWKAIKRIPKTARTALVATELEQPVAA